MIIWIKTNEDHSWTKILIREAISKNNKTTFYKTRKANNLYFINSLFIKGHLQGWSSYHHAWGFGILCLQLKWKNKQILVGEDRWSWIKKKVWLNETITNAFMNRLLHNSNGTINWIIYNILTQQKKLYFTLK